jgi:hypothetical protein
LIFINSAVSITIGATGIVNVNGGNGGTDGGGNCGGGGGGSGGSIIMQSPSMTHNGTLQASGGAGGASNVPGNPYYGVGGVGAPGRIRLDYNGTLNGSGTITPAVGAHYAVSVLTTMAVATQNVTCAGGNDGAALATVMNGNSPYTYSWLPSGGNNTAATGLAAGTYTFTVTDALGCTATTTVAITEPPVLTATVNGTGATCAGNSNGTATITGSGGTPGYTYLWSPGGATTATATGLTAGCYTVLLTDAAGCTTSQSVCITEPSALSTSMASTNPSCNGVCNGTATVSTTGGTAPFTFLWCNNNTTATATGLCGITCAVTVVDANGCVAVDSITLTEPPVAQVNVLGPDTMICDPASVQLCATGGVTYFWSDNTTGQCVTVDTTMCLQVMITDAQGCISMDSICVTDNICLGIADASAMEFSIAPNPAKEVLIITHGYSSPQRTEVYDAQGRIVKTAMLGNKAELNVIDLAPGLYSVRIGEKAVKLIIE